MVRSYMAVLLLAYCVPAWVCEAKPVDYSVADHYALHAPPKVEVGISTLANYLAAGKPRSVWDENVHFWVKNGTGDEFKARAVYRWIADRISYDFEVPEHVNVHEYLAPDGNYWTNLVSPSETLKTRKAYCVSYSLLYQALADRMGLPVVYIEGSAVADGVRGEHAWNAVKIGSQWKMIDVTWGAGTGKGNGFKKSFDSKWFLMSPAQFGNTHQPCERDSRKPCYL